MANNKHVQLLREGVLAFNAYRENNPEEPIDLSQANFRDQTFVCLNLRGVDMRLSSWRGCTFRDCIFEEARADQADFERANIVRGHFAGSSWRQANLDSTSIFLAEGLESADLVGTDYGR